MAIHIQVDEVGERLGELLDRATLRGERIIVERDGKPIAAVVSAEDLQRLESEGAASLDTEEAREARFRQSLRDAGLVLRWPTRKPLTAEEQRLIHIDGQPLSEQIIEDRERRDQLLSGQ